MMLVEIQHNIQEKCQVIFHGKIQCVFQCGYLQIIRIAVTCPVDGVVKGEKIFLSAEHYAEQAVFILSVDSINYTSIIGKKVNACNLL